MEQVPTASILERVHGTRLQVCYNQQNILHMMSTVISVVGNSVRQMHLPE